MKKTFLFVGFSLFFSIADAQPRNPLPSTPDQVWQNDQDLQDDISSRTDFLTQNTSGQTLIGQGNGIDPIWSNCLGNALCYDSNGNVTQPGQPSFLVVDGTGASNVTGDATAYTELWPTEIYDQGSDFASNTFTAPVNGRYLLTASVQLDNILTTHNPRRLRIATSNRNYDFIYSPTSLEETSKAITVSVIADMDANDTATVVAIVAGSTKTVDISASESSNYFSGSLIN